MEIIGLFGELKLWDEFYTSQDIIIFAQVSNRCLHNKNYFTSLLFLLF